MQNTTDVVKSIILEKFNECIQAGQSQATIDANVQYITDLVLNDYKPTVLTYIEDKKTRLEAEKAALAKIKLDAETQYNKLIKIVDDAQVEIGG